jgi:hypothetical protein
MRKKVSLGAIIALSLALLVSTACFAPVLASVTYYDHASGGGVTVINLEDHQPPAKIEVARYDRGDHGVGDYLAVSTLQFVPSLGKFVWVTAAVVTDSPSIAAFWKDFVLAGLPGAPATVLLVKHWELQVFRIGKIVFASWALQIPSPIVTLPAGCLLFRGYSCAQTLHSVAGLPNGVTITLDVKALNAHATFLCPAWKYCGPVGEGDTTINIGLDQWITHT